MCGWGGVGVGGGVGVWGGGGGWGRVGVRLFSGSKGAGAML